MSSQPLRPFQYLLCRNNYIISYDKTGTIFSTVSIYCCQQLLWWCAASINTSQKSKRKSTTITTKKNARESILRKMWVISVTHIKSGFHWLCVVNILEKPYTYVASRLLCIKMKINHFSGGTAKFDTDRYIYASLILTQLNPYPRSAAEIHYALNDLFIPFFFCEIESISKFMPPYHDIFQLHSNFALSPFAVICNPSFSHALNYRGNPVGFEAFSFFYIADIKYEIG